MSDISSAYTEESKHLQTVLTCQNDVEANKHGQWSYGRRQIPYMYIRLMQTTFVDV